MNLMSKCSTAASISPLFPVPPPPPPSKGNVQQLKAMTNPRKTCSKNCASLLLEVLEIPSENGNRDITKNGVWEHFCLTSWGLLHLFIACPAHQGVRMSVSVVQLIHPPL